MMFGLPYFGFPPFRREYPYNTYRNSRYGYPPYRENNVTSAHGYSDAQKVNHTVENKHTYNSKNTKVDDNTTQNRENHSEKDEENPIFEILGIKLYFDDILIVCLLFFLYNEGVKDQSLFISLILLLLS